MTLQKCCANLVVNNNRRRGDFLRSLDRVCLARRVQCIRTTKPKPHRPSDNSSSSSSSTRSAHCPGGPRSPGRVAAASSSRPCCPGLAPCCPFPLLFLTEQPHTYVIPTAPKTTRTGCCPSRSVQSGRPWTCFPPSSCNCCVAGPAYYLSVYLPAYLVWSSFVRTSPASRKPTKPDSNSTFAAVVSCL